MKLPIFELGDYYIVATDKGGFDVYRQGPTAATRCAQIGYKGDKGLQRAIEECKRRTALQACQD